MWKHISVKNQALIFESFRSVSENNKDPGLEYKLSHVQLVIAGRIVLKDLI